MTEQVFVTYGKRKWNPLSFLNKPDDTSVFIEEECEVFGFEVGDDRVDVSSSLEALQFQLEIQETIFSMKTSREDTSISNTSWNFTEVSGLLPYSDGQTFDKARKTGDSSNLCFLDVPKMRLIINTHKGNTSSEHVNSSSGKASMITRYGQMIRPDLIEMSHRASFFQDGTLGTHKIRDPKYLPPQMGGLGQMAPFGNHRNLYSYVMSFRHGTYERVHGTATMELKECVGKLQTDSFSANPKLCARLRERQEYLWGTYSNMVFIPNQAPIPGLDLEPLYREKTSVLGLAGVESRLVSTKLLANRRNTVLKIGQKIKLTNMMEGWVPVAYSKIMENDERKKARRLYDSRLKENLAFQKLLDRDAGPEVPKQLLNDKDFSVIYTGQEHFTIEMAKWLYKGGCDGIFSIKDLRFDEEYYLYSDSSIENDLRVSGIPLHRVLGNGTHRDSITKRETGLYNISTTLKAWAQDVINKLETEVEISQRPLDVGKVLNIYLENPEWVSDDSGIVSRCIKDNATERINVIVIITSDKKLCQKVRTATSTNVWMVHPLGLLVAEPERDWDSLTSISITDLQRHDESFLGISKTSPVYVDTGSVHSHAKLLERERDGKVIRRTLLSGTYGRIRESVSKLEVLYRLPQLSITLIPKQGETEGAQAQRIRYRRPVPSDEDDWRSRTTSNSSRR